MATPLLTTKLYIPPVRPELVSRPRLIERLDAGLHRKLTLVYMNNHWQGQAVGTARQLKMLMEENKAE